MAQAVKSASYMSGLLPRQRASFVPGMEPLTRTGRCVTVPHVSVSRSRLRSRHVCEVRAIMKVIGAGFGRTGTLSVKAALEELGVGPCYHMVEVFDKPRHVELWQAAAEGKSIDWEELFAGYNAVVDWPACTFYQQLMQAYPEIGRAHV